MKFLKTLLFGIAVFLSIAALWEIRNRLGPPEDGMAAPFKQSQLDEGKAAYYGVLAGEVAISKLLPLANNGNAEAQYYIGLMHDSHNDISLEGREINNAFGMPDYLEAVKWYRLSADQGFSLAQAELGRMYYYGHGVNRNSVQALMWLSLATSAMSARANAVHLRDTLRSEMSQAQIIEAMRLAEEWRPAHP